MKKNSTRKELVISIHDLISSGKYTPSTENIKYPMRDIENAIIEAKARNWTYKTVRNLAQTQEDAIKQVEEIKAHFDTLLRDYIYSEYKLSVDNISKKRIEIQEKINQCNQIKDDNKTWSTLDEATKNDLEESLVKLDQDFKDTMQLISQNPPQIPSDDNKVQVSEGNNKKETAEAAFGVDKETIERDMNFNKPPAVNPAKIKEEPETALDILKRIEQKLNDLLAKVDSFIKRIDIMISVEYPQVSKNREEAKANESQKEVDAETEAMDKALEKSGTKIEEIETVVKGSGEVLVVQSGELLKQEIEKEAAEAGRARELADKEAQAHELEQEERNLRKKSSHLDEDLGEVMPLDDLFENINEVEDKAKEVEKKPTPTSKPTGRKL